MLTITQHQQAYCKIAQFHQATSRSTIDKTAFERILPQIDNVNFKVLSDKSRKCCKHDSRIRGSTPLHFTCYHKHIEALNNLLERGANFTEKNDEECTALYHVFCDMFIVFRGNPNVTDGILKNALVNSILTAHVKLGLSENPRSASGLSHFHIACAANHLEAVRLFLSNGVKVHEAVNVDSSKFPGYTPLHFAARFCSFATAKLLLEHGADLQMKTAKGLTPLHVVIERNFKLIELRKQMNVDEMNEYIKINEKIIKLFIDSTFVINVNSTGLCKIYAACTLSDSSLAERFVRDVDVNSAVSMESPMWPGYTALHFAIHFNAKIVKLLLENGANIKARDASGLTPVDLHMKNYGIKGLHDILTVVPALKDIWFSDNQTRLSDFINAMQSISTFHEFFKKAPKNVFLPRNCPIWPNLYISHLAVIFSMYGRDIRIKSVADDFCNVEACLSFDDNAIIQDAHGRTPIHLAFYEEKYNIVDLFLNHQSQMTDIIDNDGLSHLHIACSRANKRIIRMLLSTGADVNSIYNGKTLSSKVTKGSRPLHSAVASENAEIIKLLLQHGAEANATDADGMTPIHRTLIWCPPKVSKKIGNLLFSSCDLKNVVAVKGRLSHLHVASFIGNEKLVEGLLKLGADANAECSCKNNVILSRVPKMSIVQHSRRSPLHYATIQDDWKIVELLLQSGADILHKKPDGMTLLYEILNKGGHGLPSKFGEISTRKYFASKLANDATLRKRTTDDTGITLLHIACALYDVDQIRSLLVDSKSDLNAQVHSNSPIWSGATPLHLLVYFANNDRDLEEAAKPLLDNGASVTLMDDHKNTPLHTFLQREEYYRGNNATLSDYNVLRLLLKYHKDFSLNSMNDEGISHFHLACKAGEYTIVEKFLENGVDVNLPITHRSHCVNFQTPLHLVLQSRLNGQSDTESQLRTIDLLLKYGADVNAQDENCSTALLEAARKGPSRELFFEKLIKAGADINYKNLRGESALEILLSSSTPLTDEECSFLSNNRVSFNIFNPITQKGIFSMIQDANYQNFFDVVMGMPSLFTVDRSGRTPIHNIVTNETIRITDDEYVTFIERFMKLGYDIDAQDSEGKTALHLAALNHNEAALFGLLISGADINVTDTNNEPAITKHFQVRYQWNQRLRQVPRPMKKNVALHVITLQLCGLEINFENLELANSIPRKKNFQTHCERVLREIEMTKLVTIGTGSLTLKDFLSETGAVAARPTMASAADREAIDKFFESINVKRFPYLRTVLKLQYKKMLTRLRLTEAATDYLREILGGVNGFPIPEICLRMIVRFFTNTEVKQLITSMAMKVKSKIEH